MELHLHSYFRFVCLLVVPARRWYAAWCKLGGQCCSEKLLLADTSVRFGQFHEVCLALRDRAGAYGLAAKILFLRAIRSRGDRIL